LIKKIHTVLILLLVLTGCSETKPKLGISDGHLIKCPKTPNCVSSHAKDEKHFIQPIVFTGTSRQAQSHLLKILIEWKGTKIVVSQDHYIQAEFTSKVFGFVDDVEFYFPATGTEAITIHSRSASRIGKSDFGVNRKRIEHIRDHLTKIMAQNSAAG
jgi:uncharacterized protein (DUF1499 family)